MLRFHNPPCARARSRRTLYRILRGPPPLLPLPASLLPLPASLPPLPASLPPLPVPLPAPLSELVSGVDGVVRLRALCVCAQSNEMPNGVDGNGMRIQMC